MGTGPLSRPGNSHGGSIINHAWNPDDYRQHSCAQQAWAHELIGKLALSGNERVLDLGCGEGKVAAEIAARLPSGPVLGLDLSCDILDMPFEEEFDVVFSNAALHWVRDHGRVFSGIARSLSGREGGFSSRWAGGERRAGHGDSRQDDRGGAVGEVL